jgi:hypothetical protein
MQTDFDFNDMTGHLTGPLLDFYLFYLEIDHPSQLRFDYEIFLDDDIDADDLDDISQLPHPERFTRELLLNDVHTRDYAVGRVEFGRYGRRKVVVVVEQNASPLLVYWKTVSLPTSRPSRTHCK